ncbi:Metallo-dependent phosphatase-like protein [Dipodascopsis tothii]|uniref:Metallo-dependent phosphatase-like protein n=1 Tax=Dipodascopsis tothii TaxID=44089 RepID=UPI0034CE2E58
MPTNTLPPPTVRLVHFNDVYHISPQFPDAELPGGAARFVTAVREYRTGAQYAGQPPLITVFSGDAFNPSLESSVTKGKHMVEILKQHHIGTDVAVYGNHDFDFGVDQLKVLNHLCDFPWLISNVLLDGRPIANGKLYHVIEQGDLRIGFVGLIEKEWLQTINSLPEDLVYRPFIDVGLELSAKLRADERCDLVIALTHMREPNDLKLAESVPAGTFDLILGGHDHFYSHRRTNGTDVLCSGTDFRNLTYIQGFRSEAGGVAKWTWDLARRDIHASVAADAATTALVDKISGTLNQKLDKVIGWSKVPLDTTFETVRTRESNMGNFVADIMRVWYGADIALVAGGTLRSDTVYPAGAVKLKDIVLTFPFEDPCVVIEITGRELLDALENGVSKLPALEGRFLQVSGVRYTFCTEKSPRVQTVTVNGEPLDLARSYTCATRNYMVNGKDGFESLMVPPERQIVDEEQGLLIVQMLRMWFLSLKLFGRWKNQAAGEATSGLCGWRNRLRAIVCESLPQVAATNETVQRRRQESVSRSGSEVHLEDIQREDRPETAEEVAQLRRRDIQERIRRHRLELNVISMWQEKGLPIDEDTDPKTYKRTHKGISPELDGRIARVDVDGEPISEVSLYG